MIRAAVLALILVGCGGSEPLPRTDACAEQADYWCGIGGIRADRCAARYVELCAVTEEDVEVDDQGACLDALAATPPPWTWDRVPAECHATWTVAR